MTEQSEAGAGHRPAWAIREPYAGGTSHAAIPASARTPIANTAAQIITRAANNFGIVVTSPASQAQVGPSRYQLAQGIGRDRRQAGDAGFADMAARAMHRPCQFIRAQPFIRPAGGRNSIKEGRFLVARRVSAVVDVRGVSLNRQRNHGGNGGEREDDGHCCDEGLHGWSPLVFDERGFEQRQPRRPGRNPT